MNSSKSPKHLGTYWVVGSNLHLLPGLSDFSDAEISHIAKDKTEKGKSEKLVLPTKRKSPNV